MVHPSLLSWVSVSPTPGSLLLMGARGGGGGLGPLSASASQSPSYVTPGSPSPIRLSQVSGFQNLSASLPPLLSHFAPSAYFQNPLPQPRTGSRPLGDPAALSPGGREGGAAPSPGPGPCRPPPHQPGFIKQTGPYIARPRGPGSRGRLIWRGGSARLWGRRWGKGGRGAGFRLPPEHSPPTCPLLQPRESPRPEFPAPAPPFLPVEQATRGSVFPSVKWDRDYSPSSAHGSVPVGWGLQICSPGDANPILMWQREQV